MTNSETDVATDEPSEEESSTLDLKVNVDSPSACQRHLTVTVAREDVNRYFDDAVGELMSEANVPGFRPGRAPRKLVESHFKNELADKIKGTLLMDSMSQVTEEMDFSPISEPNFDFDAVEIPDEGPLTFEFDIEVRPEFDMPQWKGLKLDKPTKDFGKKDIDDHLAKLLRRHAVVEPTSDPAEIEDVLVVDLEFKLDGKKIAELKDTEITIRPELSFEDGVLSGFGKLMKGSKSGDRKSGKLRISPQANNEDLRGEEVDVEIEVLDVKRLVPPKLTEEMMDRLGDFENEGDLRDDVKDELERQLSYHQNQSIRKQITSLLTESADWELPPDLLRRQAHRELQRAAMELRSSGFSDDEIRMRINMLKQNSEDATEMALKEHFILERIAEDEDLEATDADYDQEIMMMAMQSGESPRSMRAKIEKQDLMDALRNQIVERQAIGCIQAKASFNETAWKTKQASTFAVDFAIGGASDEIPDAKHGGDQRELEQPVDRT